MKKSQYLIPIGTFLLGTAAGINWSVGSISPLRFVPVSAEDAARSYGVGEGAALMNCVLINRGHLKDPKRKGSGDDRSDAQLRAFDVRWRSLHWAKHSVEWNYYWQGYNDTIEKIRATKIHSLSKYFPGECRQLRSQRMAVLAPALPLLDPAVGSTGAVASTRFRCSADQQFVIDVMDRLTPDHKYWISSLKLDGKNQPGLLWNQASSAIFKTVSKSEQFHGDDRLKRDALITVSRFMTPVGVKHVLHQGGEEYECVPMPFGDANAV